MANPTTNFGWVMPTSASLVTNLPADFNTFGQAVDTSMAQLKGGTTGQILSKTSATDMAFTWITNDVGDITGVTAGTGISGGGTSGDVTVTNSMATAMTTKGDLVAATGSGTFSRLAVGSNNQILVADSSTSTGLKWATSSSGGMTKLSTTTLTGSTSQAITGISGSYTNLMIVMYGITNATGNSYRYIRPNGTSSIASYFQSNANTTVASDFSDAIYAQPISYYSAYNNANNVTILTIYDYTNTSSQKAYSIQGQVNDGTVYRPFIGGGGIQTTSAISSLTFISQTYAFNGGTVEIYGVK